MNPSIEQIWTSAGVLLGFQVTSFTWRISREVKVGESGDLTWLPVADILNLVSMVVIVIGVFVLPILGLTTMYKSRICFGLAVLIYIGYPFALAGHYEMYNKSTARSYKYFPLQEKIVVILVALTIALYSTYALIKAG